MRPPLDEWIAGMTGVPFDRAGIERCQLECLRSVVERARRGSPFYARRLSGRPEGFPATLEDFFGLEPTLPNDLASSPTSFMAVPQDEIARVVTLRTSGTAGEGKLFFAEEDLAATIEIFRVGMATFLPPEDGRLLLPGGARKHGDLLVRWSPRRGSACCATALDGGRRWSTSRRSERSA